MPDKLQVALVQFAVLYRNGQKASMSTRSGEFVTLRELREEVGNDACRFFYVLRKSDQHLDFDLDLAKSQTNENPVYYIQYAHARICSVMNQWGGDDWKVWPKADLALLTARANWRLPTKLASSRSDRRRCPRTGAAPDRLLPQGSGRRVPQLVQRRAHAGRRCRAEGCARRAGRRRAPGHPQRLAILGVSCPQSM
jgi:hypothetical protein